MIFLFSISLFVSAWLLFLVQPMIAKMLVPLLGGVPAVWNTCMVFFQAMLLIGYVYAHLSVRWLGVRRQILLHLLLLIFPLLVLPFTLSDNALASLSHNDSPALWIIATLLALAGLPFFAVSTTAPLLQKWLTATSHPSRKDPYHLYAASNTGSMLGLLSYPFLIEPFFHLSQQNWIWTWSYAALLLLIGGCGLLVLRSKDPGKDDESTEQATPSSHHRSLSWIRRAYWIFLSFIPSSLMLGVTTYISTDLVAVPLLWIVPLALYLLTFILVFKKNPILPGSKLRRLIGMLTIVLLITFVTEGSYALRILIPLHLFVFFSAAMICHGQLAKDRPNPAHLTEFYLLMSCGGVLGGLFNAILAPQLFSGVMEYPLVLAAACMISTRSQELSWSWKQTIKNLGAPALTGGVTVVLILVSESAHTPSEAIHVLAVFCIPALVAYSLIDRPVRFGLGLLGMLAAGGFYTSFLGTSIYEERNFFGVIRVAHETGRRFRVLIHGNTIHGRQYIKHEDQCLPLAYYTHSGPVSGIFEIAGSNSSSLNIGVIGLGIGSLACYAKPDQDWTFFEINPAVIKVVQDPIYFTLLQNSAADTLIIVPGDARQSLTAVPSDTYDLFILDAFSSDSIPLHLLTQEAFELYLRVLRPGGVLAFHISNRFIDLKSPLAQAAEHFSLSMFYAGDAASAEQKHSGKEPSEWVMFSSNPDHIDALQQDPRWQRLKNQEPIKIWTDSHTSILKVLKWK